jgi:hypothetical protein
MAPGIAECRISDQRTAVVLVSGLEGAGRSLNDALQEIIADETPEQRKLAAHAVGTGLGADMHDLLMSLLKQHLSLDRHDLLSPKLDAEGVEGV